MYSTEKLIDRPELVKWLSRELNLKRKENKTGSQKISINKGSQ